MSLQRCTLSWQAFTTCASHAMSTEKQEVSFVLSPCCTSLLCLCAAAAAAAAQLQLKCPEMLVCRRRSSCSSPCLRATGTTRASNRGFEYLAYYGCTATKMYLLWRMAGAASLMTLFESQTKKNIRVRRVCLKRSRGLITSLLSPLGVCCLCNTYE